MWWLIGTYRVSYIRGRGPKLESGISNTDSVVIKDQYICNNMYRKFKGRKENLFLRQKGINFFNFFLLKSYILHARWGFSNGSGNVRLFRRLLNNWPAVLDIYREIFYKSYYINYRPYIHKKVPGKQFLFY